VLASPPVKVAPLRPRTVPRRRVRRCVAALVGTVALAALPAAFGATPAAAAAARPPVEITKIWYDSPGTDNRSRASLNAEYVVLRNNTARAVSLRGWTVRDRAGHTYTFGAFSLRAGASVTLHTGAGGDTASHRYWGRGAYVWNNDRDTAYLRRSTGTTVDSCSYHSTRVDYTTC